MFCQDCCTELLMPIYQTILSPSFHWYPRTMEALLMACSLSILCVCCASTEVKTVNIYNSVILEGCCDISHDRLWKFNTELVYSNHLLVNDTFDGIMSLFSNYSLVIDYITLDLDGFYQCICNLGQNISMKNYSLVVKGKVDRFLKRLILFRSLLKDRVLIS